MCVPVGSLGNTWAYLGEWPRVKSREPIRVNEFPRSGQSEDDTAGSPCFGGGTDSTDVAWAAGRGGDLEEERGQWGRERPLENGLSA